MTGRSPRLRIGFDARALVFPAGGVRRYVRELFARIPALAPDLDMVAIDPPPGVDLPPGTIVGPRAAPVPTNFARAALSLPAAVRAARLDLFHAPAYTGPLWGDTPVVLTIHDVSYARRPDYDAHPPGPLRLWFYRRSALRAAHVITVSGFSRDEIAAAYDIRGPRITVIPEGVCGSFCPRSEHAPLPVLPPGVRVPFVLHVGELHRRRNLETALDAVLRVRAGARAETTPLQLVCAGVDRGSAGDIAAAAAAAGAPDALVLTGPVSESTLVGLYQHASALVYPSLYEGFGLPVLEAMACGLPVIAADAGSVPEVLAGAGILVRPGDADGFATALRALLADDTRRAGLVGRGLSRAGELTWDRAAQATLGVYRNLLR